ncbi:GTP 3',8-cyclase MoaA [Seleniivibrio woodruffii]|uniref:GTP 3',8-cyclase n=2 Tax=Seleniivibrio woodruffii TaxID=1078050 RepID=A0A4R1K5K7_9BACT|nr:GTP 3',8-cyclase MoaA [Seleniivibrio woodruffii]TCK59478.1 cyclic pyranopterin monophosphate synthase subunit MoaA [Seleniivibrio woodruffii]TVZ35481.1 cyclic pyranopterin monophosphate synthase subunit MoaA [Seleniivibrio woodruffii]
MSTPDIKDKFGREIRYLRISITDRCNFRCKYCMPIHDFNVIPHPDILSYEEMMLAVEAFVALGVRKVRVTGGEPLVRRGVDIFLEKVGKLPGIEEVTLTTNGSLLKKHADSIKAAGIKRINVSLDSLKEERYSSITGGFGMAQILAGIKYAKSIGLGVKTNTVAIRNFNHDEILDFCEFAVENDINVRFIEFMPVGNFEEWKDTGTITGKEILDIIGTKYTYEQIQKEKLSGPAVNYRLSNGAKIGIITPISNHFCSDCDKLRITADGKLRPCLLSDAEIDLLPVIRSGNKEAVIQEIIKGLNLKEKEHHLLSEKRDEGFKRTMSKIGG